MALSTVLRILNAIVILASWLAAAWILRHTAIKRHHSMSHHSGLSRSGYLIFALTLSISAVVYTSLNFLWLIPHFQLPPAYAVILVIAATCQIATGWIRDGASPRRHSWHNLVAYTMAITMPILLILTLAQAQLSMTTTIAYWTALIISLVTWTIFLGVKSSRRYYLWYQSAYILSFQIATLAIIIFS